jgi:hypothetical protein
VITRSLHNILEATGLVCSVFIGVLDCWRHLSRVRLELADRLGDEFVRIVPELCVLEDFRVRIGDDSVADHLLDEEKLRFDVEEFDLDCCFSWCSIV